MGRRNETTPGPAAYRVKRFGEIKSGVWEWSEWMLFQDPMLAGPWKNPANIKIEPLYTANTLEAVMGRWNETDPFYITPEEEAEMDAERMAKIDAKFTEHEKTMKMGRDPAAEELLLRLQRSSEFLRDNETPLRPMANVIRQSIADTIDEAINRLSDDE